MVIRLVVISAVLLAGGVARSSGSSSPAPSSGGAGVITTTSPPATATAPLSVALDACAVTVPSGPPPPTPLPPAPFIGNGRLWAGLWPHGLVIVPEGDIERMKFMWRRGPGAHGLLHISGAEISSGSTIRARTSGYGRSGFNATSIAFPGQGLLPGDRKGWDGRADIRDPRPHLLGAPGASSGRAEVAGRVVRQLRIAAAIAGDHF